MLHNAAHKHVGYSAGVILSCKALQFIQCSG
jgi:hypothetical protein